MKMAKDDKRKTVVEYDTEDGLRARITVETFNRGALVFGEQKDLQDHFVDQVVFAVRGAPFLGTPPISRMKIR